MRIQHFLVDQFVDDTLFNNAESKVLSTAQEILASGYFFTPGVVNSSALLFGYNNNLIVTVDAPSPFKCLFGSGAFAFANGITNGITNTTYSVDFTSLIPGSSDITAYIVASYATVLEDPITIIGPPAGHPDFSSSFVPYVGYITSLDSLNIFATTTVPDNQVYIELARVTLQPGQTSIVSVDTSHQVPASIILSSLPMIGDVTGLTNANIISNLQGKPVIAPNPINNEALTFNGNAWVPIPLPGALPPYGPASGDLSGVYPGPKVAKIQGFSVSTNAPTDSQVLQWNSSTNKWTPTTFHSLQAVYGPFTLSSNVSTPSATLTTIMQKTIVMPTGGNWRLFVDYSAAYEVVIGGNSGANIGLQLSDGTNVFGELAEHYVNASGSPITAKVLLARGTISPVTYAGGSSQTITLQAESSTNSNVVVSTIPSGMPDISCDTEFTVYALSA